MDRHQTARLRVPLRHVDGAWECSLGGPLPVADGATAELLIDKAHIIDKAFLKALDGRGKHKVLDAEALLFVGLTIKPGVELRDGLAPHLIRFRDLQARIATALLPPYNPATLCFVEVRLAKPKPTPGRPKYTDSGGLWLITKGITTIGIQSPAVILPPPVSTEPAISLNHAFTLLSQAYEPWRLSHTGNVYSRVLYEGKSGKLFPLEVLRSAALDAQEHAIAGQLWDEFMKKMTALRNRAAGK